MNDQAYIDHAKSVKDYVSRTYMFDRSDLDITYVGIRLNNKGEYFIRIETLGNIETVKKVVPLRIQGIDIEVHRGSAITPY